VRLSASEYTPARFANSFDRTTLNGYRFCSTPQRGSSAEESTGLLNGARGSALNDDDDDDDDGPGRYTLS